MKIILKGKNYYTVRNYSDFSGRIKPSDSEIVRAVKEMNKINFVSTNKANTSRLIELTDLASNQIIFEGLNTLNQLSDITKLIDDYNDKFEHGSVLIDDDFKDKSIDYLKEKRENFVNLLEKFNADTKAYIKRSFENALRKRKSKKVAALLCFPFLGFQWVYLKDYLIAVISFLCCWTIIVPVLNIIHLFMILFMSQDKFDKKYNPEFYFYSQFNITEDEIVDEISDTKYDINGRDELFYEGFNEYFDLRRITEYVTASPSHAVIGPVIEGIAIGGGQQPVYIVTLPIGPFSYQISCICMVAKLFCFWSKIEWDSCISESMSFMLLERSCSS